MKRPRVNRQAVVETVLEYVWMIFGMFIYSFGWLACIMPATRWEAVQPVCRCCSTISRDYPSAC